ncbi:MAG: hypothetical protein OEU54_11810 [Gemmatimonadota bacterium]|nr:hypothetical protein [Gemmatimonadota bacterium]
MLDTYRLTVVVAVLLEVGGSYVAKEMLLVGSKTKDALKSSGLNVSGDALDALNGKVYALVKDAQTRCTANGRKTIRGSDF